jgi:cytochrome b561
LGGRGIRRATLIVVHACAAFRQLTVRRDDVMQRMLAAPPEP